MGSLEEETFPGTCWTYLNKLNIFASHKAFPPWSTRRDGGSHTPFGAATSTDHLFPSLTGKSVVIHLPNHYLFKAIEFHKQIQGYFIAERFTIYFKYLRFTGRCFVYLHGGSKATLSW